MLTRQGSSAPEGAAQHDQVLSLGVWRVSFVRCVRVRILRNPIYAMASFVCFHTFYASKRFSRDNSCSNIFFHNALRDLYVLFVPEMNSALLKPPTGFTASFFRLVLSDFLLSSLILNALMYKYLFHVQPLLGALKITGCLGYRLGEDYTTNCVRSDFYNHTPVVRTFPFSLPQPLLSRLYHLVRLLNSSIGFPHRSDRLNIA